MLHWILTQFAHYGYFVIVAGVLLENAGIPAPGHTVVLAGAFLAQHDRMSIWWVAACACAAAIVGDNIGYWLGHRYGRGLLERHHRLFRFTPHRRDKLNRFFSEHGPKAVVISRFVTGLQTIGALMAGVSRMHWRTFAMWNVIGALAWSAAFCTAGYLAGSSVHALDRWAGRVGIAIAVLLVAGIVILAITKRRREEQTPA